MKELPVDDGTKSGNIILFDPAPAYIDHLAKVNRCHPDKEAGLSITVDCMWGNGAGWFTRFLTVERQQ